MFGTHWCTFVDARVQTKSDSAIFANSRANNSDRSGPITSIIELIRDLIVTYILTKFGADWLIFGDATVQTKSVSAIFPNSRANNSKFSGLICSTIILIQDLMGRYIAAKFGTDWSIFADARVLTKSNMANFLIQGQITRTVLVRLDP